MPITKKNILVSKASTAKRESKSIEFKQTMDIKSNADWAEIIKDIAALANTEGGIILFGITNDGKKTRFNATEILMYDPADITNKIFKHTGVQFDNFELLEIYRGRFVVPALYINQTYPPLVFINNGTYLGEDGKNKSAFTKGTIYFRHGAKSDPANATDIERIIEKEIEKRKRDWLGNIRKVIDAPPDYEVSVIPKYLAFSEAPDAKPFKISSDENAPAIRIDEEIVFTAIFNIGYYDVIKGAKRMFSDFKQNKKFNSVMAALKKDPTVCRTRYLDASNKKSVHKDYYSKEIYERLKAHYISVE